MEAGEAVGGSDVTPAGLDARRGRRRRRTWGERAVAMGFATAVVVTAGLLRFALCYVGPVEALARRTPLSFMYPSIVVAALFGGVVAGLWGVALALFVLCLSVNGPGSGWPGASDVERLAVFAFVGSLIAGVCGRVNRLRREAHLALAEREASERRITNTLEHITDAFFAVDAKLRFTYVNRQAEQFYGMGRSQMLGRNFFEVFPAHVGGIVERETKRALAEQRPVHAEFVSPVTGRWVQGDVYPTPDGLSVYFRDVTERHAAQEALRESEGRYRSLVETAQEGICQVDASGTLTYANPALGAMLRTDAAALRGRALTDLILGELTGPLDRPGAPGSPFTQEVTFRRADGSTFAGQLSTSPMRRDADGDGRDEYAGELAVITDVTERRAMETERQDLLRREQRARADAEAANRRKDQFLAVLSHELRTPLTPVIARLSLLRREPNLSNAAKAGLEMIRRNVELEARLIEDLLDVTRIARGQLKLHWAVVDAHEKLRDALSIYECDIANRRQTVRLELNAPRHFVRADGVRLQQVFWNLISNAQKYTPEGGTITIRSDNPPTGAPGCDGSPACFQLKVSDNGIGIDPVVMPRLFDPFEQGEQTLTRRYGGLGLGLAISRAIMQMHGGTLVAESAGRGQGSTFTVQLPAVAVAEEGAVAPVAATGPTTAEPSAPEAKPAAGPPSTAAEPTPAQRILLIDDNEDTLRVMARLLRLGGHRVATAGSVSAAMAAASSAAEKEPFDVLITDIGLPDGTGWDLMRQLRQRGPVRGIAISGFSMEEDLRRSREAGFIEHLCKPIAPEELERALRNAAAAQAAPLAR